MTAHHSDRTVAFSVQLAQAHQELRRRVSRLQANLGTAEPDSDALATHCLAFCDALTSHHQGEDAGMFTELAKARPDLAGKIDKLVEDHAIIGTILQRVAALAERARGTRGAALVALKGELDGLAAIMESHFRFEERTVSAALDDGLPDTGWSKPVFRP
jgi:hemerythrin